MLESVGLWGSIQALPLGVETHLTSDGQPLSSTQQSLLMLARVIASRPSLLLIDGTLDALDTALGQKVLRSLLHPEAPWTIILATQSKELAETMPQQIYLEAGPETTSFNPGLGGS